MLYSNNNGEMLRKEEMPVGNGGIEWRRSSKNNSIDHPGIHNTSIRQATTTGFVQVSVEARDKILQNQKDAALRRRKQQLQSGFIKSIDTTSTSIRLDNDPHVVPSVRTIFSTTPKEIRMGEQDNNAVVKGVNPNEMISQSAGTFIKSPNQAAMITSQRTNQIDQDETMYGKNTDMNIRSRSLHMGQKQVSQNTSERNDSSSKYTNFSFDSGRDDVRIKEKRLTKSPSTLSMMNNDNTDHSEEKDNYDGRREEESYMKMTSEIAQESSMIEEMSEDDEDEESKQTCETKTDANNFWKSIDWNNQEEVKRIVMAPCPKNLGTVRCYMRRHKGKSKLFPEYRAYLEEGDIFLMTSKKRAKKQSSNYLISIGRNDYNKHSSNIVGKLRANFLGTEFQIYDGGKNPKSIDPFFDEKINQDPRSELGAIIYTSNILGNRGPRKMQVCINRIANGENNVKQWQPVHKDEEMLQSFKNKTETAIRHLLMYENRQPKWNEDLGSYVLNFNKRVNLASVKNFQLIDPYGNEDRVVLQFGRTSKDQFIMDVQWPMSLFQAFAICLSSCDSKIACD